MFVIFEALSVKSPSGLKNHPCFDGDTKMGVMTIKHYFQLVSLMLLMACGAGEQSKEQTPRARDESQRSNQNDG